MEANAMSKLQNFNGHFCESEYEYAFITSLEREGWQYLRGNKINRQTRKDVLYSNDLEEVFDRNQPGFTARTKFAAL